jgi:hypothetical protein
MMNRRNYALLRAAGNSGVAAVLAPSLLGVTPGDAENDLSWTDNSSDETDFAIFRSTDNVTFAEIDTVTADVTTYNDPSLSNGQIYYYYVKARRADGDSAASNTASGTPVSPLVTGLINHWELTANANNSVGGGLALTNNGGVTFGASGAILTIAGSKFLSLAQAVRGYGDPTSISIWYQQTAATNDHTPLQSGNTGGAPVNFIKIESNYTYIAGASGAGTVNSTGHAATTSLVHELIVVNGTACKRYRQGVLTADTIAAAMTDTSRLFLLGAYNNGAGNVANFDGTIMKVSTWNVDKSASAAAIYNGGTPLTYPF